MKGYAITMKLGADGTMSVVGKPNSLLTMVGGTITFSGTWSTKNGKFYGTFTHSSIALTPEDQRYVNDILEVSQNKLVLKSSDRAAETYTRL
jgi:hypothetical protein